MCGILGWVSSEPWTEDEWGKVEQIAGRLFLASERRGRDAAGYSYVHDGSFVVVKKAGTPEQFVQTLWKDKLEERSQHKPRIFIGHTRAGTKGSASNNRNNHPLWSKASGLALVHNGVLTNDDEVRTKNELKCDAQVDSEVLLRLTEKLMQGEKVKHLAGGIVAAYKQLLGSAASAFISEKHPEILVLAADGNPIYLGLVESMHAIFFASTEAILLDALSETEWKYGYFRSRSTSLEILTKAVKDETLLIISTEGGTFKISDRKCELKTWVTTYAGGITGVRDSDYKSRGFWTPQSDFCEELPDADIPPHCRSSNGKEPITVDEFVKRKQQKEGKQGVDKKNCGLLSCPIGVAHLAHSVPVQRGSSFSIE